MKKIFLLSKMMSQGSADGDKKAELNAEAVNIFFIIVLAAGTFAAGFLLTPISSQIIPNHSFATIFSVAAALICLIRVFPMIINGLFMSKDVEILLTLPYSPLQLALANSISIIQTVALYQIAATLPYAIGVIIAGTGDGISILIMDILLIIFVPIFISFFVILIATLVMKALKTMANREFQKIIGVALTAIVMIVYFVFMFNKNTSSNDVAVNDILSTVSNFVGFVWIIPVAPMIHDFICEGNWPNLLYAILIDVGVVALAFIVLNAFYLSILKQVSNTFSSGKEVSETSIKASSKKSNAMGAITKKDLKLIFRDSGYYLNCIIMPVIFCIFFMFTFYQIINQMGIASILTADLSLPFPKMLLEASFGLSVGIFCACTLSALSGVASCSFSREGQSFIFCKQMPLEYITQIKAKRNVAIIMAIPIGIIAIAVFSVLWLASGTFTWIVPVVALIVFLGGSIFFIDYCVLADLKNPNFVFTKMNKMTQAKPAIQITGVIACFFGLLIPVGIMILSQLAAAPNMSSELLVVLAYAVVIGLPVAAIILAIVFEKRLSTKGPVYFGKF